VPAILTKVADTLELDLSKCRGMEFQDALAKARDIPGRRFDYDRKLWLFPGDDPLVAERVITTIQPQTDDALKEWVIESKMQAEADLTTAMPDDADVQVPWGRTRMPWQPEAVNDERFDGLKDYQRTAVDLLARVRRAILADDMGLGKTLEAISTVEEYVLRNPRDDGTAPEGPRLIAAPSSVKGAWVRELTRWLRDAPIQLVDAKLADKRHKQVVAGIKDNAWVIVNWEQLRVQAEIIKIKRRSGAISKRKVIHMKEPLFQVPWLAESDPSLDDLDFRTVENTIRRGEGGHWLAVLADEAHRAKNRKAAQSMGLHRTQGEIMLALTGTPIMNSPDELWSLLHWLYPSEFGDSTMTEKRIPYGTFYDTYVDYYENEQFGGKIVTGVKNPDALRFLLRDRMVRRTASQVRKGSLPGKRRVYYEVPLLPKQQKLYDEAEKQMWLEVTKEAAEGDAAAAKFLKAAQDGATPSQLYRITNGAARMVRLQQIIENPAILGGDDVSAIMDDFIEKFVDSGGREKDHQWVVGCKFVPSVALLAARLRKVGAKVAVYHGDVDPADRTKIEEAFQNGLLDAIVGTTQSMKEGITLTRGHLMYSLTAEWVPADNDQWEARCANRTGQQNFTLIYRPQAPNTVATDNVRPTNQRKERIVRTVVATDTIEEVTT
jgi:SNF2 family DNA or RNA helicase